MKYLKVSYTNLIFAPGTTQDDIDLVQSIFILRRKLDRCRRHFRHHTNPVIRPDVFTRACKRVILLRLTRL